MLDLAEGTDARVVHASSFSKTVSPGVRVGYLIGPADEIGALAKGASETYISPNMLAESIVFELCRSGALDANIETVNAALAQRRDAVVAELGGQIPEAEFVAPGGGYFLWLDLAEGTDTRQHARPAKEEGVAFVAGPDFMLEGGENSLRLSFASVPPGDVPEGIARIARALASIRALGPAADRVGLEGRFRPPGGCFPLRALGARRLLFLSSDPRPTPADGLGRFSKNNLWFATC